MAHETFQKLMDQAYAKMYNEEPGVQLSEREKDAFLLGTLNYQVCNGGFRQWVDNGYACKLTETKAALKKIGTENALKVIKLIESFEGYVDDSLEDRGCMGNYWVGEEPEEHPCYDCDGDDPECEFCGGSGYVEESEDYNPGAEIADSKDSAYYEIEEALLNDIESYFKGEKASTSEPESPEIEEELPKASDPEDASGPKYPDIRVKLVGKDGNAFAIMGTVSTALRRARVPSEEVKKFNEECMSGSYSDLLRTCMEWVEVH